MTPTRADLVDHLAERAGLTPLTTTEIEAALDLAGAAAHGTGDRTSAPIACFLAGLAAADFESRDACIAAFRDRTAEFAPVEG
ncbi:MAG: DUF6457 domain-containing protein [Solirubrobacteraceae bacterium]|jgi:hypothetical protein